MPAPKGHPRYGGRKKGVLNKKTELLMDKCERLKVDPFEALLHLANSENELTRLGALKEICQYLYPKRKSMEHSGEIGRPFADKSEDELKEMVVAALGE